MYITNEKGRSMIEMLGVLAIIGVLTIGSLSILGKARQQYTISQILSETTTLISHARKMTCDYEPCTADNSDYCYKSYTDMLALSDAYPDGISTDTENEETIFILTSDAHLKIDSDGDNNSAFKVTLSNLPDSACVAVMTADWNNNGLISAATNKSDEEKSKVVDLDLAASTCASTEAKLILTFIGCTRSDKDEGE